MSRDQKEQGFSLAEALVALSILAIALSSLIPSFIFYRQMNAGMEARMQAVTAAEQVMDERRTVDPSTMPSSGSTSQNVMVGHRNFTITTSYCLRAAYCGPDTRDITVEVNFNGNSIYRTETVYTRLQ